MKTHKLSALYLSLFLAAGTQAQDLKPGFQSPPNAAQPRVWWHWMNGNITKEGIRKDLEWMKRVGIGGFQNFDANLFTPVVVPKKLVFMTPEWKEAFRYTTELADKTGLEMAIAGSPGWSVTGGPWVPPQDAMKKYVWTETRLVGGQAFSGKLPQPSNATGKFQNVKLESGGLMGGFVGEIPKFYQDAAVLAYRVPPGEKTMAELNPKVTSSGGTFALQSLTDGNLTNVGTLSPGKAGEEIWIQYEFDTPQTIKAFSVAGANHVGLEDFNGGPENRSLQVSDDGVNFRQVAAVSGSIVPQNTVSISPTQAKYVRLVYKTLESQPNLFAAMAGMKPEPPKPMGVEVAEFVVYTSDRVDQFEDKAGFTPWKEEKSFSAQASTDAIAEGDVVDLTSKMNADGTLNWQVPAGNWMVVRFGYSLTGRQNHPASPEATGLEVDKLDKEAVKKYINTYLDMYKDATGGMMGSKGLQYMILDSYEAGHMTWTKNFPAEFQKRRGYSILNWLPALTGRVVKSTEASEKFLWDFRKTIGEMIAENHYDIIGEALHNRGMKRYTESHENKRIYLADGMDVKRYADVPMSAMWTPGSLAGGTDEEVRSEADIRESASVAHIYGQNIVAAESMTAIGNTFAYTPERLKRTADLEMASGLNRFVMHTSVHQPLDDKKPGFSLGPFGQWLTRQETWAEQAKPWMEYLGRSSYLLQQGKFVADVLYYYGENHNITSTFAQSLPNVPAGYEYDFVNASALRNVIQAKNGKLVTASGMTYNLLVLDESARYMTVPVLKKIRDLVKAGVKVTGTRPEKSPSLADSDAEFQALVKEVWSSPNVTSKSIGEMLKAEGIQEDVIVKDAEAKILYVHRQTPDQDIYWLNNRSDGANDAEISFRVTGKVPELWNPMTGKTERVSYQIKDGRTVVPLHFDSWDTYFIVFKDKTAATDYTKPASTEKQLLTISSPWQVSFQEGRGAPAKATFNKLASLTESDEAGIKYFSGTASYQTTFNSPEAGKGVADLGEVKNIAEVYLNGKYQGTVWKEPFRLELTDDMKKGSNALEVRVTNLWVNRIIGDAQPGTTEKFTFTTMPFYQANSPLLPSGLLGPVMIFSKK